MQMHINPNPNPIYNYFLRVPSTADGFKMSVTVNYT